MRRVALQVPRRRSSFPEVVEAGLRVGQLGQLERALRDRALSARASEEPVAEGWFVHVFVDRDERRPVEIPAGIRASLERLVVETRRA